MRHGEVELDWADGTYPFWLGMGEIRELEDKANAGIFQIAESLNPAISSARALVIVETIRIGLIGGGMAATEALKLTRRYGVELPMPENLLVAFAVVSSALSRVNGTVLPKESPSGEAGAAKPGKSTSPPSTQPAR